MRQVVLAVVGWGLIGCADARHDSGLESRETDASRPQDASATDDEDGGIQGGDSGDAQASDEDASLPDGGEPSPPDAPLWPELALLAPTEDDFGAADCLVEFDANGDGSVNRRFAYEYSGDQLRRTLVGPATLTGSPSDGTLVTVMDAQGRRWASCDGRECRRYEYRDQLSSMISGSGCMPDVGLSGEGREVEISLFSDPPGPERRGSHFVEQYDSEGHLDRRHEIDLYGQPHDIETTFYDVEGREIGRLVEVDSCNDEQTWSSYHPNGRLASYRMMADPDELQFECAADGWETESHVCLGFGQWDCEFWRTTYTKDESGVITSSQTTLLEPEQHTFSSVWHWSENRLSVEVQSMDDLGAWSANHTLEMSPPAPERVLSIDGHQESIRVDTDANGTPDLEHIIHYTGPEWCSQRHSPSLAALGLAHAANPFRCERTPVPSDLSRLYNYPGL